MLFVRDLLNECELMIDSVVKIKRKVVDHGDEA